VLVKVVGGEGGTEGGGGGTHRDQYKVKKIQKTNAAKFAEEGKVLERARGGAISSKGRAKQLRAYFFPKEETDTHSHCVPFK